MPYQKRLVSVDFDGTIVHHAFPEIGEPLPEAFEVMKELQDAGYLLILNTCRENHKKRHYLDEAIAFCKKNGIEFRSVNKNHQDDDFRDDGGKKVFAHYYIDDRNLGGFPGWDKVREILLQKKCPKNELKDVLQTVHRLIQREVQGRYINYNDPRATTIHLTKEHAHLLAKHFQYCVAHGTDADYNEFRMLPTVFGLRPVWDAEAFKISHNLEHSEALEKLDPRLMNLEVPHNE